jgi:hypothetical protein
MYIDRFGYMPTIGKITWDGGRIESIPNLTKTIKEVERCACKDGYLYPPIVFQQRLNSNSEVEEVPGFSRPALLYKLPASHTLEFRDASEDQRAVREGMGGLVIHFMGFLFGHRCQFEDWWVDSRISVRGVSDRGVIRIDDAGYCVNQATATWVAWPVRQQRVGINALFLHNRAPGYEWEWERFQAEYSVLDAVYALTSSRYKVRANGHKERIRALCDFFGLAQDRDRIDRIVRLRNDLIHEALWAEVMPCTARPGDEAYLVPYWLHKLTARLLLAAFKIDATYIRTAWWTGSNCVFNPMRS